MSTAADGTIKSTIVKQPGHGPYFWIVIWHTDKGDGPYGTVFSYYEDAESFADSLAENDHVVDNIDLGVDRTRKLLSDAGEPEEEDKP